MCPCDYCALVFLCYWESINKTRLKLLLLKAVCVCVWPQLFIDWTKDQKTDVLGLVEDALHTAGVPCKSTGSTNGPGTKNTLVGQLPPTMNEASTKNASRIIPDLVLIAIHLSGRNSVGCALDGADHIVDFKTLQGLSNSN